MKSHPPIFRELVLTARRQGKSAGVIARELNLPVGTVKDWLFNSPISLPASISPDEEFFKAGWEAAFACYFEKDAPEGYQEALEKYRASKAQ